MATDLSTSLLLVRAMLWIAVLSLLVASAVTDIRDRIIPNRHVVWVASAGLALALLTRPGMAWASLLVACVVFLGLGTLVPYNFLGGGDGKLLTAVVLTAPLDRIGPLLMAIALAGGLLSAAYLAAYHLLRASRMPQPAAAIIDGRAAGLNRFFDDERARMATGQSVPYALAILGGAGFYVATEFYRCLYETSCSL